MKRKMKVGPAAGQAGTKKVKRNERMPNYTRRRFRFGASAFAGSKFENAKMVPNP